MVVLETHAAVWWTREPSRLGRVAEARLSIERQLQADELEMHADPADRFIVATALRHGAPLVSKDRLMRSLRFIETIW